MKVVSANSETKLFEAMNRLLSGQARHTDGNLTKANLAREAKVSPATLYRSQKVISAWNQRVTSKTPRNPEAERLQDELANARNRIRNLESQNLKLKENLTASVTVIAELSARLTSKEQSTIAAIEDHLPGGSL